MTRRFSTIFLAPLATALVLVTPLAPAKALWPFGGGSAQVADAAVTPVRVYRLSGGLSERPRPFDLFGSGSGQVLGDLLAQLRADIDDSRVKSLLFKVREFTPAPAQAEEIARILAVARKSGKYVEVHLESLDLPNLLAFSGADALALTPEATVLVAGLRAEVAHVRELLANIGLEADFEAVGDYKSAGETFTRDTMSDAARENLEALLDDVWKSLRERVAERRRLPLAKLDTLIDRGLLDAETARTGGLVDAIGYWQDRVAAATKRFGEAGVAWPVRPPTPELGSLFDLMKLLGDDSAETPATERPAIAVLTGQGPIVEGRAPEDLLESDTVIAVEDFLDDLHEATSDPRVKAIVLRIDSPGGSALASDLIHDAILRAANERPIVVSLGATAASGGYYIASAGQRIFANETTLTGSIGVFGGKLVYRDLMKKVGVHTTVIARGGKSGLLSGLDRFNDDERQAFRASLERTYRTFVNRVARGRNMGFDAVDRVAKGRVWTGRQAVERGLVDAIGGLDEAIAEARRRAGLEAGTSDVLRWPKGRGLLDLFGDAPGSSRIALPPMPWLELLPPALQAEMRDVAQLLRHLFAKAGVVAMLPWRLQLK
jgi:protease-4